MPARSARTTAAILTFIGLAAFVLCLVAIAFDISWVKSGTAAQTTTHADPTDPCKIESAAEKDPKLPPKQVIQVDPQDANGKLRIVDVLPGTVRLGSRLCVIVAGVASQAGEDKLEKDVDDNQKKVTDLQSQLAAAQTEQAKTDLQKKLDAANVALSSAKAAQNQPRPTVDVTLFLNGRRSPVTLKVPAVPTAQSLIFDFGQTPDANSDDAKFWRGLVASKTDWGLMSLKVGVSRSQSSSPETEAKTPIEFRLYWPRLVGLGAISMILLLAGFGIFAKTSSILRDTLLTNLEVAKRDAATASSAAAANATDPVLQQKSADAAIRLQQCEASPTKDYAAGTFSLGRAQMAVWLWLSTAGFVFIWLTLGIYQNLITQAILVLLGINGVTGLAAVILDRNDSDNSDAPQKPAAASQGFWTDLMSDGDGPKLHRIQMIGWTAILAVIFTWNAVANFIFVDFDTNLLLLMGIVNSTYLGFKTQENKPAKK